MKDGKSTAKPVIGWREWIALPELGIPAIKVKVDTGARSSALHASDIERFTRRGKPMVRFTVHPRQRNSTIEIACEAEVIDERHVRSSSGKLDHRPVILTSVRIMEQSWPIEVTLASRDVMGFRMLLGRQAIRGRFVVDPGRSYRGGRPAARKRRKKKIEKRQGT